VRKKGNTRKCRAQGLQGREFSQNSEAYIQHQGGEKIRHHYLCQGGQKIEAVWKKRAERTKVTAGAWGRGKCAKAKNAIGTDQSDREKLDSATQPVMKLTASNRRQKSCKEN